MVFDRDNVVILRIEQPNRHFSKTSLLLATQLSSIFIKNGGYRPENINQIHHFSTLYPQFHRNFLLDIFNTQVSQTLTPLPVLPGVFHGFHQSTLISAKATQLLVKPGMSVLVIGTGVGLEYILACTQGAALVQGVDTKPMACLNTQLAAALKGFNATYFDNSQRLTQDHPYAVGVNDLMTGLGIYDLIIFNMPHETPLTTVADHPICTNTQDPDGRLLNQVADQLPDHMHPNSTAVLTNSESQLTRDFLQAKTHRMVLPSFLMVSGTSQAYIINPPDKWTEPWKIFPEIYGVEN